MGKIIKLDDTFISFDTLLGGNVKVDGCNLNNEDKTRFVYGSPCTNAPSGVSSYGYAFTLICDSTYRLQFYVPFNDTKIFMRVRNSNTWGAWKSVTLS